MAKKKKVVKKKAPTKAQRIKKAAKDLAAADKAFDKATVAREKANVRFEKLCPPNQLAPEGE